MIKQAPFTNAGTSGIKHIDATSRHKRKQEDITYNYIIFHNEDIKITAYNESGNWSMTEGWQPYTDPEANFSLIGQHAQTWQKYADRAFIGRDDGLLPLLTKILQVADLPNFSI